jgi:hypothetical protein
LKCEGTCFAVDSVATVESFGGRGWGGKEARTEVKI